MDRRRLLLALAIAASSPALARSEGREDRKKGGGASFIQLPTITANIVRGDGRRGVMTLEAGVDVPDTALRDRAQESIPRLRAAFAQVVQVYAAGLAPTSVPNADYLSRELQRQTDFVLGRRGARLLLGTILLN